MLVKLSVAKLCVAKLCPPYKIACPAGTAVKMWQLLEIQKCDFEYRNVNSTVNFLTQKRQEPVWGHFHLVQIFQLLSKKHKVLLQHKGLW